MTASVTIRSGETVQAPASLQQSLVLTINARAFIAGNHIVFNSGEYNPGTPEGEYIIAHEMAHVKQQTGGALSLLPQADSELKVDPDPSLEREADQAAKEALSEGDDPQIQSLPGTSTDVHIQRLPAEMALEAIELFEAENEGGGVGDFQQRQNEDRIEFLKEEVEWAIQNLETHEAALDQQHEEILDAKAAGDQEREAQLQDARDSIEDRIAELTSHIEKKTDQVALTDDQRQKLYGDSDFDGGEASVDIAWTAFKALVELSSPEAAVVAAGWEITEATFQQFWNQTDGSLTERLTQVKQAIFDRADTGAGESQGVGEGGNV